MSSNLGFAILGHFKFKRFHSWWYDLSSTCNQRRASIWILFTKCSFKWYLVLPPCHLSWFTFQRRIYISSLECCLRENVRDDLQYKWYPMPFFHIWSHTARDIWPRKFQKIYIFNPSGSFSWSGSIGNCKTAKLFLFAVLLQFNPSQICFIKI